MSQHRLVEPAQRNSSISALKKRQANQVKHSRTSTANSQHGVHLKFRVANHQIQQIHPPNTSFHNFLFISAHTNICAYFMTEKHFEFSIEPNQAGGFNSSIRSQWTRGVCVTWMKVAGQRPTKVCNESWWPLLGSKKDKGEWGCLVMYIS